MKPWTGRPMQAFEASNGYFDQAAALVDLTDNMRTLMVTPDCELWVEVMSERDSDEIGNFLGDLVQHDNARGPFKGGLRSHPHVDGMPPPTSVASDRPSTCPPPP